MTVKREAREAMSTEAAEAYARGWRECWESLLAWVTQHSSPPGCAQSVMEAAMTKRATPAPPKAPEAAGGDPGAKAGQEQNGAGFKDGCCHKTRLKGAPCAIGRECPHDRREPNGLDYRGG